MHARTYQVNFVSSVSLLNGLIALPSAGASEFLWEDDWKTMLSRNHALEGQSFERSCFERPYLWRTILLKYHAVKDCTVERTFFERQCLWKTVLLKDYAVTDCTRKRLYFWKTMLWKTILLKYNALKGHAAIEWKTMPALQVPCRNESEKCFCTWEKRIHFGRTAHHIIFVFFPNEKICVASLQSEAFLTTLHAKHHFRLIFTVER